MLPKTPRKISYHKKISTNRRIRLFKENNSYNDIVDFTNSYLAYLLDEGFNVSFKKVDSSKVNLVKITIVKSSQQIFDWSDIKDYIISYLDVLKTNYSTSKYVRFYSPPSEIMYTIDKVINDDNFYIENEYHSSYDNKLKSIEIKITI